MSVPSEFTNLLNANPDDPIAPRAIFNMSDQIKAAATGRQMVGASGALFGILAGVAYLFPNDQVMIYFLFPIKMKWLVLIYGGLELWAAIQNNPQDPVAHVAHLGGGLVGF
ncbi:rhomboid family intramembrane serine protease [Paraflavitalea speifideaquila]|uniref:rhomboid family intramembrane serine protease n=1 Tax=Paraflavitalea speifideaquila TaxID=3076558 RepID=UPI0028E2034D|nr:rhomboid family intramembrane serine protease [Paraflavitalea speifideiaquila]